MSWVMFENVRSKFKSRASIAPSGIISFTKGAALQFKIDKERDKFARFYYNATSQKIGIKFFSTNEEHTMKTNFRDDSGFWFSGTAFLTRFDIMPEITSFYEVEKEDDMVVIKLETARERITTKLQLDETSSQ